MESDECGSDAPSRVGGSSKHGSAPSRVGGSRKHGSEPSRVVGSNKHVSLLSRVVGSNKHSIAAFLSVNASVNIVFPKTICLLEFVACTLHAQDLQCSAPL